MSNEIDRVITQQERLEAVAKILDPGAWVPYPRWIYYEGRQTAAMEKARTIAECLGIRIETDTTKGT